MKKAEKNILVYSTDGGRTCPGCGHPLQKCRCGTEKSRTAGDGIVRISRQTKGRKGSGVSLISGLPLKDKELAALAKQLKKRCGSGGTIKDGVIEIQGDHREILLDIISQLGYRVKTAGG
jgi:translation initiation factor 1